MKRRASAPSIDAFSTCTAASFPAAICCCASVGGGGSSWWMASFGVGVGVGVGTAGCGRAPPKKSSRPAACASHPLGVGAAATAAAATTAAGCGRAAGRRDTDVVELGSVVEARRVRLPLLRQREQVEQRARVLRRRGGLPLRGSSLDVHAVGGDVEGALTLRAVVPRRVRRALEPLGGAQRALDLRWSCARGGGRVSRLDAQKKWQSGAPSEPWRA